MYVRSRAEVGEACKTKRPTSCVMIIKPDKKNADSETLDEFKECKEQVLTENAYVN